MLSPESVNTERERANLLSLIKLTLKTLIDQSSSATAFPLLDDKNADVTNFILTLERVLNFRTRANWLSERRYFWDFVRPACLASGRQNIIERVEEVSKTRSIKEKGRTWVKFALMEKKLSELLKLVISDLHLVRKFYQDDSIMIASQAFVLCDQLAGLSAIDFSFCFKQDGSQLAAPPAQHSEVEVIDLTPYLCYKSRTLKQLLKDQSEDEENRQPSPMLATNNEMKPLNLSEPGMISFEKHKLEVEQRKYFEELLRHRDRELQQLKSRYETLKNEREKEVAVMENIILELQLQLNLARGEAESIRKKSQSSTAAATPPKTGFSFSARKLPSPPTPTNEEPVDVDMNQLEATLTSKADSSSRRSSLSTTTSTAEDDQYDMARRQTDPTSNETKVLSSPEMVSSATSLTGSSSSDDDEPSDIATVNVDEQQPVIYESGHFEPVEMTAEQVNLLEEARDSS